MIDVLQLILVKPDSTRLGWGVVKFVGFLQVSCRNVLDVFSPYLDYTLIFVCEFVEKV